MSPSLDAAPEFTVEEWPPTKKLPSTNNTPIESFWRWQRNGEGHTIKMIIQSGADRGIFCPQLPVHKYVNFFNLQNVVGPDQNDTGTPVTGFLSL